MLSLALEFKSSLFRHIWGNVMNQIVDEILKRPYGRVIVPEEEGGYFSFISEFEGCFAQGETAQEAFDNLNEVAKSWVEAELEAGREIPQPK